MPYKTWAIGEEVLAADFNSFVQQQVIAVFASAAARNAAIPAPANGQCASIPGIGLTMWDGAAWITIASTVFASTTIPTTWGPTSGGTAANLVGLNLPAQTRPYSLEMSCSISCENTVSLDTFQVALLADGALATACVNRHNGANVPMNYSLATSIPIAVPAGVPKALILRLLRLAGTGSLVSQGSSLGVFSARLFF